ncbi:hypothetical protein Sjap_006386 [Stephania japonica]|uniref:BHLH domain-containing protein n=1 Tax=Stephania japonica TaxID=461633 RepID=A0AAP0PIV4_9MAGN
MEELPLLLEQILWSGPHPLRPTAFTKYRKSLDQLEITSSFASSNHQNMNKRMLGILRSIHDSKNTKRVVVEDDRSYRHMMNERFRRHRQKESYLALHSILPSRTKVDKSSIAKTAAAHIRETREIRDELMKKNWEIREKMLEIEGDKAEEMTRMNIGVKSPRAIESLVVVLKCLKGLELKARAVRSEFSQEGFSAVLDIQSKIEDSIVEKAMASALTEVDKNFQSDFQ